MRISVGFFVVPLVCLLGCGGDYEAAYVESSYVPAEIEVDPAAVDPTENILESEGEGAVPVEEPQVTDPTPDRTPAPDSDPGTSPETDKDPTPDSEPEKDRWDPDWTEHEDASVKGCLEMFPSICNKVDDCSDELPALGLFGGFCKPLFDGISPMLEMGCEQLAELLKGAGGEAGALGALGGAGLQQVITKLLKGCIDNFTCDLDFIVELGQKLGGVFQLFSGQGGQDFTSALPQLMELAQMCGGIGNLLPF